MRVLIALSLVVCAVAASQSSTTSFNGNYDYVIEEVESWTAVGTYNATTLYTLNGGSSSSSSSASFGYDWPVYLLDLHGDSHYEMGYAYGYLLAEASIPLIDGVYEAIGLNSSYEWDLFNTFLDWQWEDYLSQQCPEQYMDEISGMEDGGFAVGVSGFGTIISRVVVLANLPGSIQDMAFVIERELLNKDVARGAFGAQLSDAKIQAMLDLLPKIKWEGMSCSMLAVWGNRTVDGNLRSARNLDWTPNTGAAHNKLITVYHPPGGYSYATFGFAGFMGSLAGMSSQGLTAHEANLEEGPQISFFGFPWVLRLRYIMETATNISEAKAIWEATNNTVGFNFMISSANDVPTGHAALVMETNYDYTAYFLDDDPREAAAVQKVDGNTYQLGFPLKGALYRTNNPFDPVTREHFSWGQGPTTNSEERYKLIYTYINGKGEAGELIDDYDAVNVTHIVAQKGPQAPAGNPYVCPDWPLPTPTGSSVISVTFNPGNSTAYAAWGNGEDETWRSACCNTYVKVDLSKWW